MHTIAIWVAAVILVPHAAAAVAATLTGRGFVTVKTPAKIALLLDTLFFYALLGGL